MGKGANGTAMKKVKGIVLENTKRGIIVLTRKGEYRRLPANGRIYPLGAEVEIDISPQQARIPAFAVAAAVFLIIAFTLFWQFTVASPAAYLALDINPSLLLALDKEATVIEAEAMNAEGEILVGALELKGMHVVTALELILREARLRDYLAAGRENVVLLSLAAPPGYSISEDILQQSASRQLIDLEVDTYLKISSTTLQVARDAKQKNVSLNALLLAEELAARGLLPVEENAGGPAVETGATVRDLLERVLPQKVFTEKEFIPGNRARAERAIPGPPERPGDMPQDLPMPPALSPPAVEKEPGPPERPVEDKEKEEDRGKELQPEQNRLSGDSAPEAEFPGEDAPGRQRVNGVMPPGNAERSGRNSPEPPAVKPRGSKQ